MARPSRIPRKIDDKDVPPVKVTWQTVREAARLAGYLWPYRRPFVVALAALLLGSSLSLAFPFVTGSLIDGALTRAAPSLPWYQTINGVACLLMLILALQAACAFG